VKIEIYKLNKKLLHSLLYTVESAIFMHDSVIVYDTVAIQLLDILNIASILSTIEPDQYGA